MAQTNRPTAARPAAPKQDAALESDDPLYIKAKHEIEGYTLVPKNKIEQNHTVEQASDKVYGNKEAGEFVIAKRKPAAADEGDSE